MKRRTGTLSWRLRKTWFACWGEACAYCNQRRWTSADHLVPLSKGGSNMLWNLVPACRSCNETKGDRLTWPLRRRFWERLQVALSVAERIPALIAYQRGIPEDTWLDEFGSTACSTQQLREWHWDDSRFQFARRHEAGRCSTCG
jgi:hypothetical protein